MAIEPIDTAPALHLAPQDVDTLLDELRVYHAIYRPLFQRREQREWSEQSRHGLLLELPRQSIAPLVLARHGPHQHAVRAMQPFLSEGAWDDAPILCRHWQEVDRDLGDDQGVLLLDGRDFPTQGPASVGVQRQDCGALGQRAHCQAGVVLGDASQQGDTLRDRRLYLPQAWVEAAA